MKTLSGLPQRHEENRLPRFIDETCALTSGIATEKPSAMRTTNVVAAKEATDNLVTLNSMVRLRDVESGATRDCMLVDSNCAPLREGMISVFSPLGIALIGCTTGDIVECWELTRCRRLCIEAIVSETGPATEFHD